MKAQIAKFTLITFLSFVIVCYNSKADDGTFKVIIKNGNVKLICNQDKKVKDLFPGYELSVNDTLFVDKESYICFSSDKGNLFEISKMGKYKISAITSNKKNTNSNLVNKYVKYLFEAIKEGTSDKDKFKLGLEREIFDVDKIVSFLPQNCRVLQGEIKFIWFSKPSAKEYTLKLKNNYSEIIKKFTTKDTSLIISTSDLKLKFSECYHWTIMITNDEITLSDESYFCMIKEEEEAEINQQIEEIKSSVENKDGIIGELLLAKFYENNKLFNDAYSCYERLLSKNINSPEINKIYKDFLVKIKTAE